MTHYMKLNPEPFSMIENGRKTFELRLYDDKRQLIQADDLIIFSNTLFPEKKLTAKVIKLHVFRSFKELYNTLPLQQCGYLPEELSVADPKDMELYYSPSQQAMYGVVGIEIELI